jgi:glyoxylase-like metal-dependent hydrolase (beta-lactamase superfamily II)
MADFTEVAERVWVARHDWFDLNVPAIGSERGLVVVDTHASAVAARTLVEEVRRLGAGEVVAVVNTHEHFDHTFGNGTFREVYGPVPIHAHEVAAAETIASGDAVKQRYRADPDDPRAAEVLATEPVPADHTFSSVRALDLGDRVVELVHPGRGHTAGDLVARVPDVEVLLAGDLVEESAPPSFGSDCHPLEWPATLDFVLGLLGDASVVVPGHGARVTRQFVEQQRAEVATVAETIRQLAAGGVRAEDALDAAEWPYPRAHLANAVRRGYAQLPAPPRSLPLV